MNTSIFIVTGLAGVVVIAGLIAYWFRALPAVDGAEAALAGKTDQQINAPLEGLMTRRYRDPATGAMCVSFGLGGAAGGGTGCGGDGGGGSCS